AGNSDSPRPVVTAPVVDSTEGFGNQGVMGKAVGLIGRKSIAEAMVREGSAQMRSPVRPEPEQDKLQREKQRPKANQYPLAKTRTSMFASAFMQLAG
ncbi:MAG: hypothetical protein WBM59_14265, partial [Sedimenticolaceae bacterium]